MIFTTTFEMEMETTTYDYYNSMDQSSPGPTDSDNYLLSQLSILYYLMFLFSLFSNGLVLVIMFRFEKLTTVTNILLLNLVASSLIFMSSLPFMGVYMQLSNWIFGGVMCKIVGTVYYLGFYSSILFLTLLTFDRHLAVVYSLSASRLRNRKYAIILCAVVWLVSGLACIRPMILHNTFTYLETKTFCQEFPQELPPINMELLRTSGFYLQLFLFLIFPLAVIIYCYVRIVITVISSKLVTKFKTVKFIFVIVLLFFICWTPFNIVMLMYEKAGNQENQKLHYALEITRAIAYFYFCISPIFYTFVGNKFQNYFKQLLVKRFPWLKRHASVSQQSRRNMSTRSTRNEI